MGRREDRHAALDHKKQRVRDLAAKVIELFSGLGQSCQALLVVLVFSLCCFSSFSFYCSVEGTKKAVPEISTFHATSWSINVVGAELEVKGGRLAGQKRAFGASGSHLGPFWGYEGGGHNSRGGVFSTSQHMGTSWGIHSKL